MDTSLSLILCVDDDPGVLAALKRTLCSDFDVLTALNVEEAAHQMEINPDVEMVVSDHRMPGGSGFDFLTWCNAHYPHVIRIALTGFPDSCLMKEAVRTGLVLQVISKPWDGVLLIQTLKAATRRAGGVS